MIERREAKDLTPEERKRIVAGWQQVRRDLPHWEAHRVIAACLGIHEDTVWVVLTEEGE